MKTFRTFRHLLLTLPLYTFDPWIGNLFEFDVGASYAHRTHATIDEVGAYLTLSPWPYYEVQMALNGACTSSHSFTFESAFLEGRYNFWDEKNNPLTATLSLNATFVHTPFTHDIAFPHHGKTNLEADLAFGKELPFTRLWALVGIGTAEHGSPWIRYLATIEHDWECLHAALFFKGLSGLGSHPLQTPFTSYRSLAHHTLDLGATLAYTFPLFATLGLEAEYNLYGKNFPHPYFTVMTYLSFPFSL